MVYKNYYPQLKVVLLFLILFLSSGVISHSEGEGSYVRVVSADPDSKTYTFSCEMDPNTPYLRDFFIRKDTGDFNSANSNEAESHDRAPGDHFTYTFQDNGFYHVGCVIVNDNDFSQLFRGDLHIDLRDNSWNPEIIPVSGNGLTVELRSEYSGSGISSWEVLDAQTGEVSNLGTGDTIQYTAPGHGLYDFILHIDGKSTGLPIEIFDSGDPYFPDKYGVPHGITNTRDGSQSSQYYETVQPIPTVDLSINPSGSGWNLNLATTNYNFYQPSGEMAPHVDGQGHAHWYLDGIKQGRIYSSSFYTENIPSGEHTIKVVLSTNDHREYTHQGSVISDSETITVDSGGDDGPGPVDDGLNRVDTNGGLEAQFICNPEGSSEDLVVDWNFGDGNFVYDIENSVSHSYANEGNYYVQCDVWDNVNLQFTSLSGNFEITGDVTPPNNNTGDNNDSDTGNEGGDTGTTIHNNLETIPAVCNGGTITSDNYDGGRHVTCTSESSTLSIDAWDKPNSQNPDYFEMYKKFSSGDGIEICLADACISDGGFDKSKNYPIYTEGSSGNNDTEPPTNETEPPNNDTEPPTNNTVTYYSVKDIPAVCDGTITSDTYDGGRHITCEGQNGEIIQIDAWNKPGDNDPQYFEVYLKFKVGNSMNICLADACIAENGYAKSSNFPIVLGNNPDDGGQTNLPTPVWLSHSGTTGVSATHFHLEIEENSEVLSTDWEVWTNSENERVWLNPGSTNLEKFHTHTSDGDFENSLVEQGRLDYSTTYKARTRFNTPEGTGTWSNWRTFTTINAPILDESSPDWTAVQGYRVEEFATNLDVPVHLAAAPNLYQSYPENERPFLYVTELYGKVKVIYPDGSQSIYANNLLNFDPFGSITGAGQMGVIGLYVDDVTGDLFVGMVYKDGDEIKNKLVRFHTTENGKSYTSSEIIIDNLPSAPSHQIEQITKHNGRLYVNLGDAQQVGNVQSNEVLVGKIISMNMDGSDVQVYAKGFRNPFGADWSSSGVLYVTDNAPDVNDRLVKVSPGENYGWGLNDNFATFNEKRIASLNVSPVDVEFNYGTDFPGLENRLYVAVAGPIYQQGSVNGKHILEFTLNGEGNVASSREFVKYTGDGYGTPMGLEFAKGGLYFTDIYGEAGFVGLGQTEARILRVVPGDPNPGDNDGEFRAGVSIIPWYPKDTGDGIEYIFECKGIDGSGNYKYNFDYGDGSQTGITTWDRQYHKYSYENNNYQVTCNVYDQSSGEIKLASLTVNPSDFIPE